MNASHGPRRDSSAKNQARNRKKTSQRELEMTENDGSATTLLSFTIDPNTAQIVKFERLDASGARHELSDDEKATLVKGATRGRLEEALEDAFEAGIACVLGREEDEDETKESEEDAELRHLLLSGLIKHSAAKRLMKREVLSRAILETLIEHSMKSHATQEGRPAAGLQ